MYDCVSLGEKILPCSCICSAIREIGAQASDPGPMRSPEFLGQSCRDAFSRNCTRPEQEQLNCWRTDLLGSPLLLLTTGCKAVPRTDRCGALLPAPGTGAIDPEYLRPTDGSDGTALLTGLGSQEVTLGLSIGGQIQLRFLKPTPVSTAFEPAWHIVPTHS